MAGTRLGSWITVPHPSIVELLSEFKEFDWLCVDMEHSPTSNVDLQICVSIIQAKGKKAFVRVAQNSHLHCKFPLDAGVDGIIIPMVNSHAEAKEAVANCLYPPHGIRGVGLARAQRFGFRFQEHLEANKNLEIIVQIEHIKAVDDIDRIVDIPGLTGVFLGPYDLSGSLGIPGQFDHPAMINAIEKVANAVQKKKLLLGAHVIEPQATKIQEFKNKGYNFLAFSIDTLFMGRKIEEQLKEIKGG